MQSYAASYNKVAQTLREALLKTGGDSHSHRQIVRNVFRRIDENDSGVLTAQEMADFVQSPELNLFSPTDTNYEKFSQLLVEQIDVNRDGTVSLEELENFLFPEEGSNSYEGGIVLDLARKALVQIISSSGAASMGSEDALLQEFVKLSKTSVKRTSQVEARIAKKALLHLHIPEFKRNLEEHEAENLLLSLDSNNDGVISAHDFKAWLFPTQVHDDRHNLADYLRLLIEEKYNGNIRELFEDFRSHGADCIYKADFVTHIKAVDPGFPRPQAQELASYLSGKDKAITFTALLDFVGVTSTSSKQAELEKADSLSSDDEEDVEMIERSSVDDAQLTDAEIIADILNSIITDIEIAFGERPKPMIPASQYFNLLTKSVSFLDNAEDGSEEEKLVSDRREQFKRSHPSRLLVKQSSLRSVTSDTSEKSPSPRAYNISQLHQSPNDSMKITPMKNSFSNSVYRMKFQQQQETSPKAGDHHGFDDAAFVAATAVSPKTQPAVSQLSEKELATVRELLLEIHSPEKRHSPSQSPLRTMLNSSMGSLRAFDEGEDDLTHGAVGYTAKELVEVGYAKHFGRWRGFPYDSWSCCNTSEFVCPVAAKQKNNKRPPSPKKPLTRELFRNVKETSPTRKTKEPAQSPGKVKASRNEPSEETKNNEHFKVKPKPNGPTGSVDGLIAKPSPREKPNKSNQSMRAASPPKPPKQSKPLVETKADKVARNLLVQGKSTQAKVPPRVERKSQSPTRVPRAEATHRTITVKKPIANKKEMIAKKIAVKPPSQSTTQQNSTPIELKKEVDKIVKTTTANLLSSYDRALKELRKEVQNNTKKFEVKETKLDLSLKKQEKSIDQLQSTMKMNLDALKKELASTAVSLKQKLNVSVHELKKSQQRQEKISSQQPERDVERQREERKERVNDSLAHALFGSDHPSYSPMHSLRGRRTVLHAPDNHRVVTRSMSEERLPRHISSPWSQQRRSHSVPRHMNASHPTYNHSESVATSGGGMDKPKQKGQGFIVPWIPNSNFSNRYFNRIVANKLGRRKPPRSVSPSSRRKEKFDDKPELINQSTNTEDLNINRSSVLTNNSSIFMTIPNNRNDYQKPLLKPVESILNRVSPKPTKKQQQEDKMKTSNNSNVIVNVPELESKEWQPKSEYDLLFDDFDDINSKSMQPQKVKMTISLPAMESKEDWWSRILKQKEEHIERSYLQTLQANNQMR